MAVPGLDPGIVPAIHAFALSKKQDVDARDKRGHDERVMRLAQAPTDRLEGLY